MQVINTEEEGRGLEEEWKRNGGGAKPAGKERQQVLGNDTG